MNDRSLQLLNETLREPLPAGSKRLLIADENFRDSQIPLIPASTTLLTNRYDLYKKGSQKGLDTYYSDFDFDKFQQQSFARILYRVSKEKPVVHHIINQAKKYLLDGGQLILVGAKNEGIKTYAKNAERCFASPADINKEGPLYRVVLTSTSNEGDTLDDRNYSNLRQEITCDEISLYSKPGVFGWNKVDQGSALLGEYLADFFTLFEQPPTTVLDLGCGYGYLSAWVHKQLPQTTITATDNNAAAILACKKNFASLGINGKVVSDDCAESISSTFSAIVCNPPFHQGFETEGDLTAKFVKAAHRHLVPGGKAFFVVNEFIPLEKRAADVFRKVTTRIRNGGFKLVLLEK